MPERLVRLTATKNHGRARLLLDTLTQLQQAKPESASELAALKDQAAKTLNVGVWEINRQLRKYGMSAPEPASVVARKQLALQKKVKQERQAAAISMYLSGTLTSEEAAEVGETSSDYLLRVARKILDAMGTTPRKNNTYPGHIRAMLADDAHDMLTGSTEGNYSATLLNLWEQAAKKPPSKQGRLALSKAPYASLLVEAVRGDVTLDEIAEAKEVSHDFAETQISAALAQAAGYTWEAVRRMKPTHRTVLADVLARKAV
jgi:hypothetical protein